MSEICKLCGRSGLEWDCDKDGDYGLMNRSGTMHVCVDYFGRRKPTKNKRKLSYLKAYQAQQEMEEYVKDTGGQMHALNVAGCDDRER